MTTGASMLRPPLTRLRIGIAFGCALACDAIQLLAGPFGWPFIDDLVDVGAMIVTTLAIGFHPLLLPTFVVELMPILDIAPTWTAAVIAVVVLRRRSLIVQTPSLPPAPKP